MKLKRSETKFAYYIHSLMLRDISEIIDGLVHHPEKPKYLVYGNFPGNEIFFDILNAAVHNTFDRPNIVPVDWLEDILPYIDIINGESDVDFSGHLFWFKIRSIDEAVAYADDFSCLTNTRNRELWYALENHKDKSISILVTLQCQTPALFGLDKDWKQQFVTKNLWRVIHLPMDFGYAVADEADNARMKYGYKEMNEYYKIFQKKIFAFAKYVKKIQWKHHRLQKREHQWGMDYDHYEDSSYITDSEPSGHSIDAFLELVKTINEKTSQEDNCLTAELKKSVDEKDGESFTDLTELIQKAAEKQKIHQIATVAEAKVEHDHDYYKYITMHNLSSDLNQVLHDFTGTEQSVDKDFDDGSIMRVQV